MDFNRSSAHFMNFCSILGIAKPGEGTLAGCSMTRRPGLGGAAPDAQKGAVDPQRSDPVCRKVAPRQAVSSLLLNTFYCTKLLLSDVKTG